MTADELLALDELLLSPAFGERAMDACTLEGFAAALVIGPRVVPVASWLPWVWDVEHGQAEPHFTGRDEVQAQVMRLCHDVAGAFAGEPVDFHPMFLRGQMRWSAAHWCKGFYTGMRLAFKDWSPLLIGAPLLFEPIQLFGDPVRMPELMHRSAEQADALIDAIVPNVLVMAAHWRENAALLASGRTGPAPLRRAAPKRGRNEPCHCGSGLKYKKCHGRNDAPMPPDFEKTVSPS